MSIFDPTYIEYEQDTKLKSLILNRLNKDKFDELSSHSPDEIWFIQESNLSGQPIVVDTTPRPTKLSEFENDVPYLSTVSWSQVTGKPTIPTKTSQLTNDSGYVTSTYVQQQVMLSKTKWRDWHVSESPSGLTFTAEQANSTVAMTKDSSAPSLSLEYSTDGSTWSDFIVGTTTVTLPNVGDSVLIRAKTTNDRTSTGLSNSNTFALTGKVAASGSILYLLDKDGGDPTQTLPERCFNNLFRGQTALTSAPELPSLNLGPFSYSNMFFSCNSLIGCPVIQATSLNSLSLANMFNSCSSLSEIKIHYTGNFSSSYFSGWVDGVAASGTFYYNGSDTTRGSSAIPSGWNVQSF